MFKYYILMFKEQPKDNWDLLLIALYLKIFYMDSNFNSLISLNKTQNA